MDRTLNPVKRSNKRRKARNWKAWKIISPDGVRCRFCPHNAADHLCSSGQPHYFRPATREELQNPYEKLYRYDLASSTGQTLPEGESVLVKRVIVAQKPELITAFCQACAKEMNTSQVLCFQRTLANGEVVGLGSQ